MIFLDPIRLLDKLRPRARDAHKGDFGHVLVVGGQTGMLGAVLLAAEAAARCGAGRVSIASLDPQPQVLLARRPELMCHAIAQSSDLEDLLRVATVVIVGPGLGQNAAAQWVLQAVLNRGLPTVIDADALNLIAGDKIKIPHVSMILTPHPGEAARLLKTSITNIQADRLAALHHLIEKYQATVVLKGAGSLVGGITGKNYQVKQGNPGMASGGMGDVLSGVIAALWVQGLSNDEAAVLGAYLHAKAADSAAQQQGERGLLASDLMPWLQKYVNGDGYE